MKYTNLADLLIAAGESIKMQEKAGIEPLAKRRNVIGFVRISECNFSANDAYEFPLAVVEGKPVFVGDELYFPGSLSPVQIQSCVGEKVTYAVKEGGICYGALSLLSWNPPKPKTVMVELLREDAEAFTTESQTISEVKKRLDRVEEACRKALESK